eukprot:CAMPEP_0201516782 /NCGR_PEP_ID=MMETSP0161_2-20130828/8048_1 /ASSEMBLY_ACC=CAM_ASM_000251 /TAXON_ID=180227 /ORGANISM="Neoparamoeba aestuarina, Strain SoJaBio B1-5/56/2" /LENGTH=217 /DNA_ID=CAMNT_0047914061 /DNA_START=170 /DNA_END=823 /DNA_ORIENTATION=+
MNSVKKNRLDSFGALLNAIQQQFVILDPRLLHDFLEALDVLVPPLDLRSHESGVIEETIAEIGNTLIVVEVFETSGAECDFFSGEGECLPGEDGKGKDEDLGNPFSNLEEEEDEEDEEDEDELEEEEEKQEEDDEEDGELELEEEEDEMDVLNEDNGAGAGVGVGFVRDKTLLKIPLLEGQGGRKVDRTDSLENLSVAGTLLEEMMRKAVSFPRPPS